MSWKSKSFIEVLDYIRSKKNTNLSTDTFAKHPPLIIYRNELMECTSSAPTLPIPPIFCTSYCSVQENAKKRIRSSGITKLNYNADTNQYLRSRKLSFQDNTLRVVKNSNATFATNGAVTSSSKILRKKYDTITSNAAKYLAPYGASVANEMSYGTLDNITTYKNKFAFPIRRIIKSRKGSSTIDFCGIR